MAARFAAENLKVKKVAVLYGTGDPYSSGVGEAFAKAAEKLGLDVVAKELLLRRRHRVLRPAAEDPGRWRQVPLRSVLLLRGWPVHHPQARSVGFKGYVMVWTATMA